MQIIELY